MPQKIFSFISIFLIIILTSCGEYQKTIVPDHIKGLWFEKTSGHWLLKIDNSLLFWQNKIEPIREVYASGSELKIITDTREVLIFDKIDSIKLGSHWFVKDRNKDLMAKISQSKSVKPGTAIIQGMIDEFDSTDFSEPISVFVNDFVLGEQHEYQTGIDSLGTFSVQISLLGTQDVHFLTNQKHRAKNLLISPGDTLTINLRRLEDQRNVDFSGKNAMANYDIFFYQDAYEKLVPNYRAQQSALGLEPLEYLDFRREFRGLEQQFIKDYCEGQNCTELFKDWFITNSEVNHFSELMAYSWKSLNYGFGSEVRLTGKRKEQYERHFMDSIDQTFGHYRLSSRYFSVINGISHRLTTPGPILTDDISFLLQKENLNTEDKEFLLNLQITGQQIKDLNESQKAFWWTIADKYASELWNHRQKTFITVRLNELEKAEDPNTRDLLMTQSFYHGALLNRNYEIMDFAHAEISKRVKNQQYLNYITNFYQDIKAQEKDISSLEIEARKFEGTGKQLLQKIVKDNPDKLIVVDFWGTWCQPCLTDFAKTKELKDIPEIKFVYLCVSSSERNWKNALIRYNPEGDHYLLTEHQSSDLFSRFEINSFPTYLLIDKSRKIHKNVPRPSSKETFLKFLDETKPSE